MSDVKRSIGQGILQQFHKYTTNRLKNTNKPAMKTVTAVIPCSAISEVLDLGGG
jgi:hypothetical protein